MKEVLFGLCMTACVMGTYSALAAGDPAAGKNHTAVCAVCHSVDGNSFVDTYPKLAAQQEDYLLKQLIDIKSGKRKVLEMTGLLNRLTEQNLADIAAYYASKKVTIGQTDPKLVELGRAIYHTGNVETGVPACMACHGPDGKGFDAAVFPALSGQHATYTAKQLNKFQHLERNNDPAGIMHNITTKMNEREVEAVSSYIQGLD